MGPGPIVRCCNAAASLPLDGDGDRQSESLLGGDMGHAVRDWCGSVVSQSETIAAISAQSETSADCRAVQDYCAHPFGTARCGTGSPKMQWEQAIPRLPFVGLIEIVRYWPQAESCLER